jgi:hypothetical protein
MPPVKCGTPRGGDSAWNVRRIRQRSEFNPKVQRMSTAVSYVPNWNLMLEHDNVYLQR